MLVGAALANKRAAEVLAELPEALLVTGPMGAVWSAIRAGSEPNVSAGLLKLGVHGSPKPLAALVATVQRMGSAAVVNRATRKAQLVAESNPARAIEILQQAISELKEHTPRLENLKPPELRVSPSEAKPMKSAS